MNQLSQDFKGHLLQAGADLVGFADLSCLPKLPDAPGCHIGVSVCVSIPAQIIRSIANGPNLAYFQAYHTLNAKLDALVCEAADWLQQQGYRAWAQSEEHVHETEDYRTPLPHKTVAVLAGLGWIGKSALFVSKEYGSAVRLSSLVTDAPLSCGEPVRSSRCGSCMVCRDACPGKAISGNLWQPDLFRDKFFNPYACRKAARQRAAQYIHKEITLCGKCIQVCPYTQAYLNRAE